MFSTKSKNCKNLIWLYTTLASILIVGIKSDKEAATSGKIMLGVLLPMRTKSETTELECGDRLRLSGFMPAHAVLHAIDQVNALDNILQNITLEAKIFDTCRSQTIASRHTKNFITMTLLPKPHVQLAGVIGASVSDVSAKVASILQVFQIPQISFKSTSPLLSNRDLYKYFMRTVPSDTFQAAVMVDICRKLNWTYVLTINSAGIYGEKGIEVFHDLAKKNNIHTDHIDTITRIAKEEEYDDIIEEMVARVGETAVSTVIVFCSLQHSHGLTMAAQRNPKSSKFVWVLSDSFEASTVTELNNICILTIQLKKEGLDTFKHYFNKLNMKDPKWEKHPAIVQFWEQWFQCRVGNTSSRSYPECTGEESLANVSQSFLPQPITLAFYAFVQGLDNLQKELCGNQTGICPGMRHFQRARLLQHLRNVSFQNFFNTSLTFDTNGEVKAKKYRILNFQQVGTSKSYKCIGEWDGQKSGEKLDINLDDIMWFGAGNRSIPQSYCSTDCDFGYVKIKREGYSFDHCWKCHECDKLQLIVNNTCIPGIPGYIPNAARNKWIKRYVLYLRWSDAISIIMVVVSVVAIIFALAVLFIFSTFHNNPTVKASGRELSCIIITGILLCFIHVFLCIAKPTDVTCIARAVMPGFALSMIYSALFMKTNRVYRVFASAMITKRRPPLVRPKSQVLITFGLISIEILITVLGQLTNITRASENYNSDTKKLILECHSNSMSYVGSLLYIVVLMILSTVYAFKTRKFPRNFNESKYIGATLYISLAVSTLFVAFYLNAGDSTIQVTITAIGSLLIGLITLLGLFAQRLFIIFFVKDADADDSFTMRQYQSKENSRSSVGSQKH